MKKLLLALLLASSPAFAQVGKSLGVADAMLKLANVTGDDVVYDLGSGDGRLPIIAAQKYGARGVGIEIDPRLVEISWRIANEAEVANRVSFIVGDLFEADLSKATVVTMYLSPSISNRG